MMLVQKMMTEAALEELTVDGFQLDRGWLHKGRCVVTF